MVRALCTINYDIVFIYMNFCNPEQLKRTSSSQLDKLYPIHKRVGSTRLCGFPDCNKTAKPGGFCISHGGGKKCGIDGCTTSVVSRGFCVAHGGGKRCQSIGCTKSAQTGGYCWIHGGGKKCGNQGCTKRAQSGGACISHGKFSGLNSYHSRKTYIWFS